MCIKFGHDPGKEEIMAVYLIDFENVHSDGLKGIDQLSADDMVYLFYSQNADTITFDMHFKQAKSSASLELFEAKRLGKNAIDFHISTFLGFLICKYPDETFFIVSRDNGYQFSFDFWRTYLKDSKPRIYYAYSIDRALNLIRSNRLSDAVCESRVCASDSQSSQEAVDTATVPKPEEADEAVLTEQNVKSNDEALNTAPEKPAKRRRTRGTSKPEQSVEQQPDKASDIIEEQQNEPKPSAERMSKLTEALSDKCNSEELTSIAVLLDACEGKQERYRGIIKLFGQNRGLEIYKSVKKM